MNPEISIQGLTKSFGPTAALRDASFDVPKGQILAILGPSGCGKTTLLRCVAGFERPDAGRIIIDGVEVFGPKRDVPPQRRRIGFLPQEGLLFPHLSVAKNIAFGLKKGAQSAERVRELLTLVDLEGYEARPPTALSGGQRQRVALARALAQSPPLVLLDEPFSALDATLRLRLRQDIKRILRETGSTAIFVTHDQDEALSIGDLLCVMDAGEVRQFGTPEEVYREPRDLTVARFVGEANIIDGELDGDEVTTALGRLSAKRAPGAPTAGPVSVMLRPEQISLARDASAGGGAPSFEVMQAQFYGRDAMCTVQGPGLDVPIKVRTCSGVPPQAGCRQGLSVKGPAIVFARG